MPPVKLDRNDVSKRLPPGRLKGNKLLVHFIVEGIFLAKSLQSGPLSSTTQSRIATNRQGTGTGRVYHRVG
ncbi:MAG: hypothetical protein WAK17_23990 [Candidatus Nitrosopolaris sp.]